MFEAFGSHEEQHVTQLQGLCHAGSDPDVMQWDDEDRAVAGKGFEHREGIDKDLV